MKNTENSQAYEQSFEKMVGSIHKIAERIKPTYGSHGGNVIIEENIRPFHRVTNDGKLQVDSMWFSDPVEMVAKNILSSECEEQEKEAGDGRKTTIILTDAIIQEGIKKVKGFYDNKIVVHTEKLNWIQKLYRKPCTSKEWVSEWINPIIKPMELKRQLDECLPIIIKSLDEQKKEIIPSEIEPIATTSSESKEIGAIIAEIYTKIGREGVIEIDTSSLPGTFYDIGEGVKLRAGFDRFGYWQTEEGKCTLKRPKVLISKDKITDTKQIIPILKEMRAKGENELVLVCEDIEIGAVSQLAKNTIQTITGELSSDKIPMKTLIIKAPVLWKDWFYEDFSKITGATPVDAKIGRTFTILKYQDLGTCDKLVSTKDETRITGGQDITEHIENLKTKGVVDDQQLLRASWLNTKVATLKVGANSETELTHKIKKAKDACHASFYALKDGVVPGAGISLMGIKLPNTIGGKIMEKALVSPNLTLVNNSGEKVQDIDFNGIIDPAIVLKSAVTHAISVASTILTATGGVNVIPQEIKDEIKAMQQRMPQR